MVESSLSATVTVAVLDGGIQIPRPVRVRFFTVIVIPSDTAVGEYIAVALNSKQ